MPRAPHTPSTSPSGLLALHRLCHRPSDWRPPAGLLGPTCNPGHTREALSCPSLPTGGLGRTGSQARYLPTTTCASPSRRPSNSPPSLRPRSSPSPDLQNPLSRPTAPDTDKWTRVPRSYHGNLVLCLVPKRIGTSRLGFSLPATLRCKQQRGLPAHPHTRNGSTMKPRQRQEVGP